MNTHIHICILENSYFVESFRGRVMALDISRTSIIDFRVASSRGEAKGQIDLLGLLNYKSKWPIKALLKECCSMPFGQIRSFGNSPPSLRGIS